MTRSNLLNGRAVLRSALIASTCIAGVFAQGAAWAQDGSSSATAGSEGDVIIVNGFRQSLADALSAKRNSGNIQDGISAEDIGKSTDQNIAEALQRVTGVAINREEGEGTTVTVRGAGPNLNQVTLNGIPLTSSDVNQSVDLSQFSADILQSITVVKTPSADTDEGSLGATISLKSFRPLDARRDRLAFEVQGRYNEFGGGGLDFGRDHKLNASISRKFADDTFGVSLVATKERQSGRQDGYTTTWFEPITPPFGATNIETGEVVTEFDYDGDGTPEPLRLHSVRQSQYQYRETQRDRFSVSGTLEFRPSDSTRIQLDATWSKQDTRRSYIFQSNVSNRNNPDPTALLYDPNTFTLLQNISTSYSRTTKPDGLPAGASNRNRVGVIRLQQDEIDTNQDNFVFGGEIEQEVGEFTFTLSGGQSRTSVDDDFFLTGRFGQNRSAARDGLGIVNGYSCQPDPQICSPVYLDGAVDDPSLFQLQVFSQRIRTIEDKAQNIYFDVDWDHQFGPITSIEFGAKWNKRMKDNRSSEREFGNGDLNGIFSGLSLADFQGPGQLRVPSDWGARLGFPRDQVTDGWATYDIRAALDYINSELENGTPETTIQLLGTRQIEYQTYGGYLMANFEFANGRVWGDIGGRYVRTDVDASGFSGFNFEPNNFTSSGANLAFAGFLGDGDPGNTRTQEEAIAFITSLLGRNVNQEQPAPTRTRGTNEYGNFLPSLNINAALQDNLLLRFAASQTIARPEIDQLNPGFNINEQAFSVNSRSRFGNTGLKPFKSNNLDLSLEWYFAPDSLLSIAVFNKDLKDFTENSVFTSYWADLRDEYYDANGDLLPEDQVDFIASRETVLIPFQDGVAVPGCMPERSTDLSLLDAVPSCDILEISQVRNGQGGYVRGVEASFQHNFSNLPGILGGLGVALNYTFADSLTDEEIIFDQDGNEVGFYPALPLVGTSRHTGNATVYWERNGYLLRLAYNTRSDYLVSRTIRDGGAHWIEGFDTLDLSANLRFSKAFSVNFQANNLLDTVTRTYSTNVQDTLLPVEGNALSGDAPKSRTAELSNTGRIYRLGFRFSF